MNELTLAKKIASGELPNLQRYNNHLLVAVRVTGTRAAWQGGLNEFIYRKPEYYLNDDFLKLCAGAAVIFEHPKTDTQFLNSDEFESRIVGTLFYPFIVGDQVNAIARINDETAIKLLENGTIKTTSPAVAVYASEPAKLTDGRTILIEGEPVCVDHIALLIDPGVWDKSLTNLTGILSNNEGKKMSEESKEYEDDDVEAASEEEKTDDPVIAFLKKMASEQQSKDEENKKMFADILARVSAVESMEKAETVIPRVDAVESGLADVRDKLPPELKDDEKDEMAELEYQAHSLGSQLGIDTAKLRAGGLYTLSSYHRRVLDIMKPFTTKSKGINLDSVFATQDKTVIAAVHGQIWDEATHAAKNPISIAGERSRQVTERTLAGHTTIKSVGGSPDELMRSIAVPARYATSLGANL